jgi:hypothetical protein
MKGSIFVGRLLIEIIIDDFGWINSEMDGTAKPVGNRD